MTKEEAKNALVGFVEFEGDNISSSVPYLYYMQGDDAISLDGDFTPTQLRALADYMEAS